jgi:hypothetical protein
MKSTMTTTVRLIVAAVLIAAAWMLWSAAGVVEDLAGRHEQIATFRDAQSDPSRSGTLTRWLHTALDAESIHEAATRDYWRHRYDTLTGDAASRERDDPASLLIAANASFRRMQREAGSRSPTVDELDRALQAYAGVLRNGGFDRDAAWNYEYIARARDVGAKEKTASRPPGGRAAASPSTVDLTGPAAAPLAGLEMRGGLPAGPTVHGRPGTHPPSTKGEEFEVITPMDYGDREAQPEPTPGVKLPRKG